MTYLVSICDTEKSTKFKNLQEMARVGRRHLLSISDGHHHLSAPCVFADAHLLLAHVKLQNVSPTQMYRAGTEFVALKTV
jgi:hypothetical protein